MVEERKLTVKGKPRKEENLVKENRVKKENLVKKDAKQLIDELSEKNNTYTIQIDTSIKTLQDMSPEDKAKKIKSMMCGKKQSIEFWDFYKYMMNRTEDIPNIVW